MKARNKRLTAISLSLLVGTTTFATILQADTITKTLKATYNNIKVTFNGEQKQPAQEPFLVDGSVYVSLRDAGQMTGNNVEWDSTNKTVKITPGSGSVSSTELANKNLEIANLQVQLKQAQEKLAKYESDDSSSGTEISKSKLEDTLEEISDTYANKNSVKWSFNELKEYKGALELEISVPKSSSTTFNNLTQSKLETFIDDVCEDIAYNHKNIEIKGVIIDEKVDEEVVSFTYSTKGKLTVDFGLTQYALDKFATYLAKEYTELPEITFSELTDKVVDVKDIALEFDKKGNIVANLDVNFAETDIWNDLYTKYVTEGNSSVYRTASLADLADFMDDIALDIYDEFDVDNVDVMLYNTKNLSGRYTISEGGLIANYQDERLSIKKFR